MSRVSPPHLRRVTDPSLGADEPLDVLITGGSLIDGSGGPRSKADLGVRDGRIVAMDIDVLLEKQRAGAGYAVTQLFYDNDVFLRFVKAARERGVTIPIRTPRPSSSR